MTGTPLIEVENLRIDLDSGSRGSRGRGHLIPHRCGETFGLVGESGCGKSITALALIGLLRPPLVDRRRAIRFDGRRNQRLSAPSQRSLRGNRIA